jgi:hypothetical protein
MAIIVTSGEAKKPHSSKEGRQAESKFITGQVKFKGGPNLKKTNSAVENLKKQQPKKKIKMRCGAEGGRIGKQHGGRTNLLEELGRVEGEHSNRNRRAEVSRIHSELNRGYKKGGRTGLKHGGSAGPVLSGKKVGIQIK